MCAPPLVDKTVVFFPPVELLQVILFSQDITIVYNKNLIIVIFFLPGLFRNQAIACKQIGHFSKFSSQIFHKFLMANRQG